MKYLSALALLISLSAAAQPPVGTKAPDINLPSQDGSFISLSSLKGRVVLLDFWASWCRPCRESIHDLKPIYKKFHDKGFEIYGVSIDRNPKAWKYAIMSDKSSWIHVNDPQAEQGNDMTATWNIRWIPATFLLDKEGNIVASAVEPDDLEKWLKKLL